MKKIIAFLRSDKLDAFLYSVSLWGGLLCGIFGILFSFFGEDLFASLFLSAGAYFFAASRFYECKSPSPEGENK